jgi:hypothetical protein
MLQACVRIAIQMGSQHSRLWIKLRGSVARGGDGLAAHQRSVHVGCKESRRGDYLYNQKRFIMP